MIQLHNKLIILDFDHTVFDTTKFVANLKEQFKKKFNISAKSFMKSRNVVKECCVVIDMDTFVEKLPYPNKQAMHDVLHNVVKESAAQWMFADVRPFVEKYQSQYDILITTHGDRELQTEKITHSNLPNSVAHIISRDSKNNVIRPFIDKYAKIHFIDDKAENIDAVKKVSPDVITYFLQRTEDHPYAGRPSRCDCADYVIKGLDEIIL